ncbi:MAG: PEP-CTERM sorting domain-containing protein [Planctomycetota bacterium]
MMRKIFLGAVLLTLTVYVQTATAALAPMMPTSSYADGHWQGHTFYDETLGDSSFLRGRIDFAVYDTQNLDSQESEWVDGLDLTGEGQYLYAYQVFNDFEESDREVAYLSVFQADGGSFDLDESSIGYSEDPESGVEPASGYLEDSSDMQVVWTWEPDPEGSGFIYSGEHSWFLLFLSDSSPVAGDYEIMASDGQGELPAPGQVPEPSTIAMLGLGAALAVFKRKRTQNLKGA